jgi:hypothetical protein
MKYKVLLPLVIVALMLIPLSCHQPQEIPPQNWTVANETEFLAKCEQGNVTFFEKSGSEKRIVYWYHRKIDNAIVELDRILYMFDRETGEVIEKDAHWRDDLPDELPSIISKEEAMDIGGGTEAYLIYIDPDSLMFSIEPTENPCWAVRIWKDFYIPELNRTDTYNVDVIVVDAVTGEILGHGTPIP